MKPEGYTLTASKCCGTCRYWYYDGACTHADYYTKQYEEGWFGPQAKGVCPKWEEKN